MGSRVSLTGGVLGNAPTAEPQPAPAAPRRRRRTDGAPAQRGMPARERTRPAPAPDEQEEAGKKTVIVYLAGPTKAALVAAAAAAGLSLTDWVLNAVDRWWERMPEMFERPTRRQSPLPSRARNTAQPATPGTTTLQLRLTAAERKVVDDRLAELQVGSRSAFLVRVIAAELGDDANR